MSWLNYAFRLMYLPIGLFGVSIATAALPESRDCAAAADVAGAAADDLGRAAPDADAERAGHGRTDRARAPDRGAAARARTVQPRRHRRHGRRAGCYAPGLLGYSAVKIASPSFYSLRDSRTPVIVSVIAVVTNVVLNLMLVRVMGYRGLALGTAIAAMFNAGLLLWLLQARLGGLEARRTVRTLLSILVASVRDGNRGMARRMACSSSRFPGTRTMLEGRPRVCAIGVGVLTSRRDRSAPSASTSSTM